MNNQTYKKIIYIAKPVEEFKEVYDDDYHNFYHKALPILKKYCGKEYVKSVEVEDIWVRDFFPIQNPHNKKLFTYNYDPLFDYEKNFDVYAKCRKDSRRLFKKAEDIGIWMDGGNFTSNGNIALCLDTKGTNIAAKRFALDKALGMKTVALPYRLRVPEDDPTGHIDGSMQFLGENTLLITKPFDPFDSCEIIERKTWIDTINEVSGDSLEIAFLPNAWGECDHEDDGSARGIYVNFLETDTTVFVPQYNLPTDNDAIAVIAEHTEKNVIGIDCDKISKYGGSLHCLTADYKQ